MDIVNKWCSEAEIKLNADKTEVMSVGKINVAEVKLNGLNIKTQNKLKYLGIIIVHKLLFKQHLFFIKNKIESLVIRIKRLCWYNNGVKLSDKMKLYNNVFLPMLSYGYQIWYKLVKSKSSYIIILIRLQRLIIRLLTNAYSKTNANKLNEIVGALDIDKELDIMIKCNEIRDKILRKKMKSELRDREVNSRDKIYDKLNVDLGEIRNKEAIWFLTEAGPFKSYLLKLNVVGIGDDLCRCCWMDRETGEHLLFECTKFENYFRDKDRSSFLNCSDLDTRTKYITKELLKLIE